MKRWIILATVLIVVAAALFIARRSALKAEQAPKTVTVTKGTVVKEALTIGSIVPEQEISVKSKVAGIVAHTFVHVGDTVEAGDPLLDIRPDPTPLERAEAERRLQLARVKEEGAKQEMDRGEQLSSQHLLADSEMETRRRAYETARLEAQLEEERLQLIRTGKARLEGSEVSNRIVAPTAGTILTCDINPGDPVVPLTSYQEGTVLMRMADMHGLIFRGTVDEVDVGKVQVGQAVNFTVGAIPDEKIEGVLTRISPKARKENATTLFDVEAQITNPGGMPLRAGYSATARIAIARAESVLTIPERVVTFDKDRKATVRIPGPGKEPAVKDIVTGISDGLTIEVKEGLAEGDQVLEPEESPIAKKPS